MDVCIRNVKRTRCFTSCFISVSFDHYLNIYINVVDS